MGTVKGDVHDIGKNLVNIMFEGAGFQVIDLGVQVAPEKFVDGDQRAQARHRRLLRVPHHDDADVQGEHQRAAEGRPARPGDRHGRRRPGHPGVRRRGRRRRVRGRRVRRRGPGQGTARAAPRAPLLPSTRGPAVHTVLSLGDAGGRDRRRTSRSASSASGSTRPGARSSRSSCAAATCPGSRSTSAEQVAGGAMVLDVNMGAPLADEAELMVAGGHADPGAHRPAAVHRLLDHRGARGRARRLPGQGAGQLGHRRGRAAGRDPAAGQAVRRGDHRAAQRRGGDPRGARAGGSSWPARSSTSPPSKYGIPIEDIVIDPLAMPIGADTSLVVRTLETIALLRERVRREHDAAAPPTSRFGMPDRHTIGAAFLPMAIAAGLTSAIMDARSPQIVARGARPPTCCSTATSGAPPGSPPTAPAQAAAAGREQPAGPGPAGRGT